MKKIISILIVTSLIMSFAIIPTAASSDFKSALTYKTTDNGFTISATAAENTGFTDSDRVSMYVFLPGYSPTAQYSDAEFKQAVCFVDACGVVTMGSELLFSFNAKDDMPYGIYNIKLTKIDKNYETEEVFYSFIRIDPAEILAFIEEFKELAEDSDFEVFLEKYIEKGFMREDQISEISEEIPESFEKMCVYLADIYEAEGRLLKINDVIDCLNGAYILSMFESGNAEKSKAALNKYKDCISSIYNLEANTENFLKVYGDLKDKITDAESLKDILNWSCVLSHIQDSSRKSVEDIMANHAELLGHDLSYATAKGVTLAEIAVYINTDKASNYYGGAFADVFKAAADAASANQAQSGSRPQSGGGSGGSGSGGGSKYVPIAQGEVKQPETNIQEEKNSAPFNDIENVSWAKDYIVSLYEKGIISGNGDGTFDPDRLVSREEFVKMLVEAFEIDMKTADASFDDCDLAAWYYPYVQIAASNGIVNGIDKYNFGVGRSIIRQDMAVMMQKALTVKKAAMYSSGHEFVDIDEISEYAKEAVDMMYTIGIISGFEDGTFGPKTGTTRAQAAVIIGRALKYMGGEG